MSGTEIAYGAEPELALPHPGCAPAYAMSGTAIVMSGAGIANGAVGLRALCHGMLICYRGAVCYDSVVLSGAVWYGVCGTERCYLLRVGATPDWYGPGISQRFARSCAQARYQYRERRVQTVRYWRRVWCHALLTLSAYGRATRCPVLT
eukprot:183361-Rhodomonas_salina.1